MKLIHLFPPVQRAILERVPIPFDAWTELRLRVRGCGAVTYNGASGEETYPLPALQMTEEDMRSFVSRVCGGSMHAYDEALRRGYLTTADFPGVRVGVGGRVLCRDHEILRLQKIGCICVRFPHNVTVDAETRLLAEQILMGEDMPPCGSADAGTEKQHICATLFYAPPGQGKTTLLRTLIRSLTEVRQGHAPLRAAVIDTAEEVCDDSFGGGCTVDWFSGYPRGVGIEIATRAFSPQVIFCDEIGSEQEAEEILRTQASGVPLIATAHADSFSALLRRPCFERLHAHHVFSRYVRLTLAGGTFRFSVEQEV